MHGACILLIGAKQAFASMVPPKALQNGSALDSISGSCREDGRALRARMLMRWNRMWLSSPAMRDQDLGLPRGP